MTRPAKYIHPVECYPHRWSRLHVSPVRGLFRRCMNCGQVMEGDTCTRGHERTGRNRKVEKRGNVVCRLCFNRYHREHQNKLHTNRSPQAKP